ncbi:hypothetical protein Cgig2_002674 [Carnegiea gigantea]|uniref:Uncharacterized protein n=1 Tax=Carnegiea gigantea TaxID=171969 RepID=A0A9Q1QB71_9CARY|nr:hypothetical protein Cgig2_002674 [Carnegiea gigantea]
MAGAASPPPDDVRCQQPLAWECRPQLQRLSTSPSLALHNIKRKLGQNHRRKLTNTGMTSTLGKVLKDQKTCRGKKEIVRKKLQLWEPIQRFPITRLALPPLGAFHQLYCLSHKLGDGPGIIILPYVELEVTSHPSFFSHGLPKGIPHRFTLVSVRSVFPT